MAAASSLHTHIKYNTHLQVSTETVKTGRGKKGERGVGGSTIVLWVTVVLLEHILSFRKRSILAEKVHHNSLVASSASFNTCSSPNASFCSLMLKQFNDDAPVSAGMGGSLLP
jgi:hypothetical protein